MRTSALGHFQPLSIQPGERLLTANSGHPPPKNLGILSQLVQEKNKRHENNAQVPNQRRYIGRFPEYWRAKQRNSDLRSCHEHTNKSRCPKNGRRFLSHPKKERTHVHDVIKTIEPKPIKPGIFNLERDSQNERKKGEKKDQGKVKTNMELKKKEVKESDDVWYKKWGCLHIKTSIPFVQLYKITNENNYLEYAQKICNTYTKFQNADGSFSINENSKTINLHTMAYALEGLFYVYNITKNEKYLQCVEKGLNWCTNQIADDGSISLWFNSRYKSKAVYPIAQIIRLMILFDKFDNKNKYLKNILKLRTFMVSLQANDNNKKVNGGFFEEFYKSMFGWKKREKLNSWGSLFAMQALYWFDNYEKINFDESILNLF